MAHYWLGPMTWFPVEPRFVNDESHKTVSCRDADPSECQESRGYTRPLSDVGNNQETAMIDNTPETPKQAEPVNPPIPPPARLERADWVVALVIVLIAVMVWLVR